MNRIISTLDRYFAAIYARILLAMLGGLLAVVYFFDTLELLRRASRHDEIGMGLVLQMGLLKLLDIGQILLPFAVLFSAMFTFWLLSRRHELVVVRAAGFSVWQFITPVLAVAGMVGVLQFAVINPIGAALLGKYEVLESNYLARDKNLVTLFGEGLWLRQISTAGEGYIILHSGHIALPQWEMQGVTALFFDDHDGFEKRIDARSATLQQGEWIFNDAMIHQNNMRPEYRASLTLPTELTTGDIEESFSSPRSHSFWRLPGYIRTLTQTGFDATQLKIHYHTLIAQPVMFIAMVLLAATVTLRPPRSQRGFMMIVSGVMTGFLVFFLSSFLQALGTSQQIPVVLAAWSPALVSLLLGLAVILYLEDG